MSPLSLMGVGAALAFILGLFFLVAWLARRFGPAAAAPSGVAVRVESRAALAPRQGVATVRAGHRTLLLSYGEGGVRLLTELDAPDVGERSEPVAGPAAPHLPAAGGAPIPFHRALERVVRRAAGGARPLMLAAVVLGAAGHAAPVYGAVAATPSAATALVIQEAEGVRSPTVRQPRTAGAAPAQAPQVSVSVGGSGDGEPLELSGPVGTVLFIGFMTMIPTLLLLMTGFTRILIVLHLLKQALGTQTAPPAHLLAAMALLLTGFVMAPTFERVHETAVAPWMAGEMDELAMLRTAEGPMRDFMLETTREQDLRAFLEMRGGPAPETVDDVPLVVVTSAFVTSELTSAFQIGFALFLPFLIIDVVVASVLMSMGMFMLPPVMVSLPFKLLLFVLVDGWSLVLGSLVQSF